MTCVLALARFAGRDAVCGGLSTAQPPLDAGRRALLTICTDWASANSTASGSASPRTSSDGGTAPSCCRGPRSLASGFCRQLAVSRRARRCKLCTSSIGVDVLVSRRQGSEKRYGTSGVLAPRLATAVTLDAESPTGWRRPLEFTALLQPLPALSDPALALPHRRRLHIASSPLPSAARTGRPRA